MQFFVKTVGHYASHIKREADGQGHFQERAFCKALPSKSNRRFVKKFVKTQLFSLFIQEAEKSKNPPAGRHLSPARGTTAQSGAALGQGWQERGLLLEAHKTAVILSAGVGKKEPEAQENALGADIFVINNRSCLFISQQEALSPASLQLTPITDCRLPLGSKLTLGSPEACEGLGIPGRHVGIAGEHREQTNF